MSYVLPRFTPDLDPDLIIDGARAALIANATILALVLKPGDDPSLARIVSEMAQEGTPTPFITLALVAPIYLANYSHPTIDTLLDVGVYNDGWGTTTVRSLVKACLKSLLTTAWAIPGMTLNSASMLASGSGFRNASAIISGTMRRGRQFTVKVIATKTSV